MVERYHGWKFSDSDTDQKVFAVFQEFKDSGEDFSAYLKQLVIADRYDEREPNERIMQKLEEIKRLIASGAIMPLQENEDDDQSLLSILGGMST